MNLVTVRTAGLAESAGTSLRARPSRLWVMWSIWSISPGLLALAPYFQRCDQAPSKLRRRLGLGRPSQRDAGLSGKSAMALERMRPTVETDSARPSPASIARSLALPM